MALVKTLLTAIVRTDGDALVMHVGEKPYVVTASGNVELSSAGLNLEAMSGMLAQLLPADAMRSLSEFGAVEHHLQPPQGMRDAFTVVAARGGDDIWIEIRRKRAVVPTEVHHTAATLVAVAVDTFGAAEPGKPRVSAVHAATAPQPPPEVLTAPAMQADVAEPILTPALAYASTSNVTDAPEALQVAAEGPLVETTYDLPSPPELIEVLEEPEVVEVPEEPQVVEMAEEPEVVEMAEEPEVVELDEEPEVVELDEEPEVVELGEEPHLVEVADEPEPMSESADSERYEITVDTNEEFATAPVGEEVPEPSAPLTPEYRIAASASVAPSSPFAASTPVHRTDSGSRHEPREPSGPAVVLPMMRTLRMEVLPRTTSGRPVGIARLLGLASTAGASALYLTSQSRPLLRIDGDIRAVEGEPTLTSAHVEASVLELIPDSARDAHGRGEPAEWVSEIDEIGRVRCSTFNDYRGAGALFQLISAKPPSAEQLGFTREIQQLATESDGLVLVASPQGGGKSSVVAGLVDFINRERGGYVITLERQIRIVHENRQALVSQREVRGEPVDMVSVTRAALRENPDVLVIEDLYAPDVIQLALDAAETGLLVLLSVTAASTVSAVARLVEMFPPDRRKDIQAALADRLRGAVSQVLLRKNGGGRVAARELLLTTAAVATLIGEGQFAQLAVALDSGRRHGMVSLNDALYHLLQSGTVDLREAYRKTDDRAALLALLKRDGVDTSFVERLA